MDLAQQPLKKEFVWSYYYYFSEFPVVLSDYRLFHKSGNTD